MPEIYFCNSPDGKTNRLGIADRGGIFESEMEIRFGAISDGSSNTLLCIAANNENAVKFWTEPSDLTIDQFIDMSSGRNLSVSACDGSVSELPDDVSRTDLRRLATRNDGEVVTTLKKRK